MSIIATTIEQSKILLELGLSIKTADMYWDFQQDGYVLIATELGYYHNDSEIPCWSLTALLELMPKSISEDGCASVYKLSIWPTWKPGNWMAIYSMDYDVLESFEASTPLDAAFEMVCWLLEQGYIKTDKVCCMEESLKQLLFKDLCARLPYKVIIKSVGENKIIDLLDLRDIDNLPIPYLRPMSLMTEQELHELAYKVLQQPDLDLVKNIETLDIRFSDLDTLTTWLNAHHLDYRGLIEKGLALEATEGLYNIKD